MRSILLFLIVSFCVILGCTDAQPPAVESNSPVSPQQGVFSNISDSYDHSSATKRPNILLIVADDLGYSDLGSYGGEIKTPNIDQLATSGLKFSQFYASPSCSVTRSMLMSGVDSHKAGLGNMRELMQPNQAGKPGYEGYLNQRVVTVATLLRDGGYHTHMVGKWHLGLTKDTSANARGFENSFSISYGGSHHFSDVGVDPHEPITYFREHGEQLEKLPDDYDFSTDYYTRKLIDYIDSSRGDGKPFFAYAAYTAPHWPLQVPDEFINKYAGTYDQGYEVLRENRLKALQEIGLVAKHISLPPLPQGIRKWDNLSAEEQKYEARKMEVYSAMVDNLDVNVGKLIEYLKDIGEYDNTFIFVMSDNGADAADVLGQPRFKDYIASFDNRYENIGADGSYIALGRGWAHASTAPFRLWKMFSTEGAIRVPAIMNFPGKTPAGTTDSLISVTDLLPTFLELAKVEHPGGQYQDRSIEIPQGKSILPLLKSPQIQIHDSNKVIAHELLRRRALRKGNWKLLWVPKPFGSGNWKLFNIMEDPAELQNKAEDRPDIMQDMLREWVQYETENGLIYPDKSPI